MKDLPPADEIAELFGMQFESEEERYSFNAEVMERIAEIDAGIDGPIARSDDRGGEDVVPTSPSQSDNGQPDR